MSRKRWLAMLFCIAVGTMMWGQSIEVKVPVGGETWCIGESYTITWISSGVTGEVGIKLRSDGEIAFNIKSSTANNGSYSWTVPESVTPGTYRIRVRTVSENPLVYDDSEIFQIRFCRPPLDLGHSIPPGGALLRPDLLVEKCWVVPEHPSLNDSVRLHALLRNAGRAPTARAHDADIVVRGPQGFSPVTRTFRVKPLAIDETHEIFLDYSCSHWGVMAATVTLDSKSEIPEENENNNEKVFSHAVSPLPDLVACMGTPVCVDILTKKKVWVVAVNRGPAESPPCRLFWYVEQNGIVYRDVPHLEPGQEHVFHRDVRFDTEGSREMTVVVDWDKNVREVSEENNRMEGKVHAALIGWYDCIPAKVCADNK